MPTISADPTKTSFDLYTSQTAPLFSGVTVDDPRTLSWDEMAGGQGTISITFAAPVGDSVGTLVDPLAKDFNQFTETDGPDNTVTYTEQATVTPGANSAPTDILDRLIYIAPPTTGQAAYDIQASVSYSGTELDAPGYPTPSTVKPVTVSLDDPITVHFSPFQAQQYPSQDPTTPPPGVIVGHDPLQPAIVKQSGYEDTTIQQTPRYTSARLPFALIDIINPVSSPTQTVIVTLKGPAGGDPGQNLGTLYDSEAGPTTTTTQYDYGANTETFYDQSGGDPNALLHRLLYFAPTSSDTYDITASVSYSLDGIGKETIATLHSPVVIHYKGLTSTPAPEPTPTPSPAPTPQPTPVPVPAPIIVNVTINNFLFVNSTNGQSGAMPGTAYNGPVAGLINQLIQISSDNLAISATTPNSFIRTGSGDDAIDVSAVSGNNVLDGGTGSNFLVGGAGLDTFFLDARNAAASTWSTVGNFHSGDAATLWGLTAQGFQYAWADGQGAARHEGLTLHATGNGGQPEASLTLAGYSTADLSNGRLAMVFGHNDGGDYLYIHAA